VAAEQLPALSGAGGAVTLHDAVWLGLRAMDAGPTQIELGGVRAMLGVPLQSVTP
jgi:hypothetical protein